MTDTTANTNFDFNDDGEQRSFDVIPANTVVTLQMTIRPGGAGDDGWLKRAADGNSEGLDCEYTVVEPEQFRKKRLWQVHTLRGKTEGHAEAGKISREFLKAVLESAKGIRPDDKSEAAQNARKPSTGWAEFDQLRFVARLGVRPPRDGFAAKNIILHVITPDRQDWRKPEQISVKPTTSAAPATPTTPTTPPAGAIGRPQWGRGS